MNELKPVAWMSMDTPPKEEDGTILVWAENMPVSMGCCEDGYYVFTECEDLHNYFEGNEAWLKEHWTLWMWVPDPGNKAIPDTHRVVSVELLKRAAGMLGKTMYNAGPEVAEQLRAIIDKGAT